MAWKWNWAEETWIPAAWWPKDKDAAVFSQSRSGLAKDGYQVDVAYFKGGRGVGEGGWVVAALLPAAAADWCSRSNQSKVLREVLDQHKCLQYPQTSTGLAFFRTSFLIFIHPGFRVSFQEITSWSHLLSNPHSHVLNPHMPGFHHIVYLWPVIC